MDKDQHKLILNRNNATQLELGLEELSDIGVSSTDYQLVENPANGSDGKYTVDNNGTLTLTVKDLNNPNAATKPITITGLAKKTDVAVVHGKYREGEANNLVDTNAQILDEAMGDEKSSSIALGNGAFVSVQNGKKANALIFGNDTYTGGIAIGENSKALNATVNIGVKDYKGKMGDVDLSDYKTYEAMGVGETSIGSNSYISGSLSTNVGSYNITTTKYMNGGNSLNSIENFGSIIVGTLNSIESNSSSAGMTSGVANNAIGMANKTQNSNGSLIFGTGNEITNSIDSIPSPVEISDIILGKKNDKDVTEVANSFRDSVSDRDNKNGGAVLAIGGGNKADYVLNSQLIGVQNQITGTEGNESEYNMVNGYQNTVTNGSNDTVIGVKNTVTGDSNIVLGDKHTVSGTNNIILGSSGKETTHDVSNTVTIGSGAQALTDSSVAVGSNAQVSANNSVAIGNGSVAEADKIGGILTTEGIEAPNYAGLDPVGTVSVGSAGSERTITNVAAGRISDTSTDAVNGSQLYATNQKVDAGWKATVGETSIDVKPTKDEDGNNVVPTLNFAGDRNIDVTADKASSTINVSLKDNVVLGGKASNDPRVQIGGTNGTIMATKNPNSISATTTIDGGNIYVGSSVSVGANDDVVMTDKDITGLSNTTWDGTTDNASRAATEGQLQAVSNEAGKHTTVTVNGGMTAPEDGSYTHDEEGRLDGNLLLKKTDNNGQTEYDLKLNPDLTLQGEDGSTARVEIGGTNGTIMATKDPNSMAATTTIDGGNIYAGNSISVGANDDVVITDKDITGLSNTEWNGTTTTPDRAATEGQLQQVSNDVNAGWIATDNNGSQVNITPDNNKLNFAGDENITVTATNNEIKTTLNDNIKLGGYFKSDDAEEAQNYDGVLISGSSGTISATNAISVGKGEGQQISISTGEKGRTIYGLTNTEWNDDIANAAAVKDSVEASTAATQGQLQAVDSKVNAGWIATDSQNHEVNITPDKNKLNFAGDENITVTAANNEIKTTLNDNITLGEGANQIQLNGDPEANDPALSVGTDKFVVDQDGSLSVSDKFNVDAETGNIYAANNSGSAIVMNDDSVAFSADGNGVVASDEGILLNTNGLDKDIRLVTKGTTVSVDKDGATFTNTNTNETTNINGGTINVGDKLVVDQNGTTTIAVNDGTVMGNNTTMTVNKDGVSFSAYGNGTTVIDGQTISAGGVVINNNGSGTINGLTNTTWDDELAKQVANSEELQGTAATQGQLQQAVSEVSGIVNKGWTAKAGDNDGEINITPGDILNFEGDGNITVSATSGTSSELKFGLNHNITLDNIENANTMLVLNTDGKNADGISGYIPDNYKDDEGNLNSFIEEHGGFAIYYANPSISTGDMTGTFGVTTDGVVHAKDVISYYSASSGSQSDVIRYSLNDVGDIVTQIAHGKFDGTGMEYTLISDFTSEKDKDTPFQSTDNPERTIGLAVRQDGAVVVGAVVDKSGKLNDSGIRINAETDSDGNNKATITGLENTEWKPKAPEQTPQAKMATFAANDETTTTTTTTSRAATEAQLDDLYSSVVGYNVEDGSIDHTHVTLGGKKTYGLGRAIGDHSGGVVLDNVAYASGTDGSEAVNVDYLNDAISDAVKDGGAMSISEKHLATNSGTKPDGNATYAPDADGNITISEVNGDGDATGNSVVISDVASKEQVDKNTSNIGNMDFSGTTHIDKDTNNLTDAIKDLDSAISDIQGDVVQQVENSKVTGGHVTEDGKVVLEKGEGNNKSNVKTDIQLTDSGVVQEGTSFDKETGTITITSQDKYSGKTSSVKVEGIASKDDIEAVNDTIGATSKEDLKDKYKDTEYLKDENGETVETLADADIALDHAVQGLVTNDKYLNSRIDSVEKRLGNVEELIDKVGAMAAAIANLRTMGFDPEAPTEIAIGVGQYKSETGIAIGVFHYPNQDFMLSASLSSSGDELMGGIGATWKLGRKSAAERAKDEEARHLEQAEEMKKLAQQEKVKAQAQRHAKLLAERQQASQKNA